MSEQKSAKLSIEEKTIYWEPFIGDLSRDLKIWGQRRQRKRRWKSEFAFFQSSSRLLQVTNFVKFRWTLQKLKSYEPYPLSSEREGKLRRRLRSSSVKREKRHFHVVVVQTRQGNVQKGVMHAQKLLFWLFNLLLFWRSRCRRRRRRLWWRRQRERLKYNWFRSRLHGSGKMFQWTIFFPCKPFTRNRANSATDCSTVCRSKLMARSHRSRVTLRQISVSFCQFKNLSRPV